jgi:NAD-dependent deacetylase
MPEKEIRHADERAAACDLLLVAGSSLVVYPAAQVPLKAKANGAKLIILNLTPTPQDGYADIVIHKKIGQTLPQIVEKVKKRLK